ncbi:esterase [Roseomonas sp. SSH11]|uniref:Esterase n=1 Tax=Pararoseomonas baculiformis TaxID=2820812 RepID=A0ABS4AI33_9PROT|nr:esterase [Pararoseomonas baculiformis]MBP0446658.1 esterase [Pararoseomonas baculiformis]
MSTTSRAVGLAALIAAGTWLAQPASAQNAAPVTQGPLTIERQGSFFVGGRTLRSDTLSTLPAYAPNGSITVDQMYVRYQVPPNAAEKPSLVLVHGCCLTGKTWETTPDGRMGWDEYFVRRGYPTYVVDQAWRGRSAAHPTTINAVKTGRSGPDTLPTVFAAGQEDAWAIFRFGRRHPETFPGLLFPLEAQDEFWKQMVPDWNFSVPSPNPTVTGLSELSRRLGRTVLVSHSQSGIYPFQTAAMSREGIAGIVSIEPGACPAANGDMKPYEGLPILVLWGDFVEESTRWAPRLRACREFARAANAAGGKVEIAVLPEMGIPGNSHMLMQDRNSLEIANWLAGWVAKNVEGGR